MTEQSHASDLRARMDAELALVRMAIGDTLAVSDREKPVYEQMIAGLARRRDLDLARRAYDLHPGAWQHSHVITRLPDSGAGA